MSEDKQFVCHDKDRFNFEKDKNYHIQILNSSSFDQKFIDKITFLLKTIRESLTYKDGESASDQLALVLLNNYNFIKSISATLIDNILSIKVIIKENSVELWNSCYKRKSFSKLAYFLNDDSLLSWKLSAFLAKKHDIKSKVDEFLSNYKSHISFILEEKVIVLYKDYDFKIPDELKTKPEYIIRVDIIDNIVKEEISHIN